MNIHTISPIGSIVIPAHNEASVINGCLEELLSDFKPEELEVVVACNGCSDDTAEIVKKEWPSVKVIEMTEPSKAAALREADKILTCFPRIYLDADVTLTSKSARQLFECLQTGALASRPQYEYDISRSDRFVKSYYRSLARLQARTNSLWGGVYGLSEEGRNRFAEFPNLIADDLFADHWFDPREIVILKVEKPAVVTVQRRLRDLYRVALRRRKGNVEILEYQKTAQSTTTSTLHHLLVAGATNPRTALDAIFYFSFAIAVRCSVHIRAPKKWTRDESSRRTNYERSLVSGGQLTAEAKQKVLDGYRERNGSEY